MDSRPTVVYTALFGDIEAPLREIPFKNYDCNFICFTDRTDLKSDTWTIIHEDLFPDWYLYPAKNDPRLKSKIVKITPPMFYSYYFTSFAFKQYYIWMDVSFELKTDPDELIKKYMGRFKVMAFLHPVNKNIWEEAESISTLPGLSMEKAMDEIKEYENNGYTRKRQKVLTAGGFLFRKSTPTMDCFNKTWLRKVLTGTGRDQLSLDYHLWMYEIGIKYLPGSYIDNPWIKFHKYRKNKNA